MNKLYKLILTMGLLLIAVVITAAAIGAVFVPIQDTTAIILKNLGINLGFHIQEFQNSIIFQIRLPRVIAGIFVGAALGTSGCVMQSIFRNPMADPGVLGVTSGSGFGAVLSIAFGFNLINIYIMPAFAIVGALLSAMAVYTLGKGKNRMPVLSLILSGIAISTFLGALTSFFITRMNHYQVSEYLFWSMGNLGGISWGSLGVVVIPITIGIGYVCIFSNKLNVLLLGEEEAQAVGLNPMIARRCFLIITSILTALAVSISGNISFVGLLVPHIMRLIVGSDNRLLIPASAFGGAIFLIACDLIARIVMIPAEISVGIVTSVIGAPYFLYLLNKARKEGVVL